MESSSFFVRGVEIRKLAKQLVLEFIKTSPECAAGAEGKTQASIFRECGFDWGDYEASESRRQQFWIIALLHELESEGKLERKKQGNRWLWTVK